MVSIGLRRPNSNGRKIRQLGYDKVVHLRCWDLEGDRLQPILEKNDSESSHQKLGDPTGSSVEHRKQSDPEFGERCPETCQGHGTARTKRLGVEEIVRPGSLMDH